MVRRLIITRADPVIIIITWSSWSGDNHHPDLVIIIIIIITWSSWPGDFHHPDLVIIIIITWSSSGDHHHHVVIIIRRSSSPWSSDHHHHHAVIIIRRSSLPWSIDHHHHHVVIIIGRSSSPRSSDHHHLVGIMNVMMIKRLMIRLIVINRVLSDPMIISLHSERAASRRTCFFGVKFLLFQSQFIIAFGAPYINLYSWGQPCLKLLVMLLETTSETLRI
jgi:hypothetical protein